MESQPLSGINLLWGCSSIGWKWISVPLLTSMGCRGTIDFTMDFTTDCRGKCGFSTWSTSCPTFFTDLGVCRVSFHIFSFISLVQQFSSPFFNIFSQKCYQCHWWFRLAILEPASFGSVRHKIFQQLLTEAVVVAPPLLTNPCHTIPIWQHKHTHIQTHKKSKPNNNKKANPEHFHLYYFPL